MHAYIEETIDGIPVSDFIEEDIQNMNSFFYEKSIPKQFGCKAKHSSGTFGVLLNECNNYWWFAHSEGQKSFIHCGELKAKAETCTPEELEAYLGHNRGLEGEAVT